MQADGDVFPDAVVEGGRAPGRQEEHHTYRLPKIVKLQACGADGGQDASVGDRTSGDGKFTRTEDEVGMRCCAGGRTELGGHSTRSEKKSMNWKKNYPKGSPTTRNATSVLSAPARMLSLDDSTISRSARITGRP